MLEAASGGDSRKFIAIYIIHSSRDAENRLLNRVIEMQAFLVTLIRKFDISCADHYPQIRRTKFGMLTPLVLGEEYKGTQLPLKITAMRER